jgi:hypothetical protein
MDEDWNSTFLKSIRDGLGMLRDRELFTDITICVEGGAKYRCQKAVLCALSPYFNAMFSTNMCESHCEQVFLPFLDSKTFETLLEFFYSGKDVVTLANAVDVIEAASFLLIQCLQDRCAKVLLESVDAANCSRLWQLAKLHNYRLLEEKTWNLLMTELPAVASTESFLALDVDELMYLLESDSLETPSEGLVCNVAMKWLEADIDSRLPFLAKILGSLKLPLTGSDYMLRLTSNYPFLEKDEAGRKLVVATRNRIDKESCPLHVPSLEEPLELKARIP